MGREQEQGKEGELYLVKIINNRIINNKVSKKIILKKKEGWMLHSGKMVCTKLSSDG